MDDSKQGRKRTLKKKFLVSLIVLTLAISLSVSTLVSILYYHNQIYEYGENALAIANSTASFIK